MRTSPARFSAQAAWSGNTAASRSSARMRWIGGGTSVPPRKRGMASAREAFQRQRAVNMGASSSASVSTRSTVSGVQELEDHLQRERVLLAERNDDAVVGGGRLQLEIEGAAEALAQRQAPGAVDARAERGVDDELHAAAFVEEALGHDVVHAGHGAERSLAGLRRSATACSGAGRWAVWEMGDGDSEASSSRRRETASESSRVRPALRRARTGWTAARRGRLPRARGRAPRGGCARSWCPAGRCRRPGFPPRSLRPPCRRRCPRAPPPPHSQPYRGWRRRR